MFNTLVASKPPAKRLSRRGWMISVALHSSVLIALAVITGRAVMPMLDKPKEQHVVFADVKPPAPKVEPAPEKVHVAPKAPPVMKRVMTPVYHAPAPKVAAKVAAIPTPAPLKISANIPAAAVVSAPVADIAVKVAEAPMGKVGDDASATKNSANNDGGKDGGNHLDSGKAYSEEQVERAVEPLTAPAVVYPESMRGLGTEGAVAMRFIVGTNGRVEPGSLVVLSSPGPAFVEAVKRALMTARYRPAEAGGQSVRQLVEQSFTFKITH